MPQCRCDRIEYLIGPVTRLYIVDFLERTGKDEDTGEVHYRCRVCGCSWKRLGAKDSRVPKLIKLPGSEMA